MICFGNAAKSHSIYGSRVKLAFPEVYDETRDSPARIDRKEKSLQRTRLELERLTAMAVVSSYVRQMLLTKPAKALDMLEAGYHGYKFCFTPEERQLILSIEADTLQEFAIELLVKLKEEDEA